MSYRFMRLLVFFDLPTLSSEDLREYRKFRKSLIRGGFYMLQESVYCKMELNHTTLNNTKAYLIKNKPKSGLVQVLTVTEKQFAKMDYIVGESIKDTLDSDDRITVL